MIRPLSEIFASIDLLLVSKNMRAPPFTVTFHSIHDGVFLKNPIFTTAGSERSMPTHIGTFTKQILHGKAPMVVWEVSLSQSETRKSKNGCAVWHLRFSIHLFKIYIYVKKTKHPVSIFFKSALMSARNCTKKKWAQVGWEHYAAVILTHYFFCNRHATTSQVIFNCVLFFSLPPTWAVTLPWRRGLRVPMIRGATLSGALCPREGHPW